MASSMSIPSKRSTALSTSKLSSSSAMSITSSLMRGHRLERVANASLFWNDVGVEGQAVRGALDQLVIAVFGDTSRGAEGATIIVASCGATPPGTERAVRVLGKSHAWLSGNIHKELSIKAGDSSCTAGRRGANVSMSSKTPRGDREN